jgi:hypothetical protein
MNDIIKQMIEVGLPPNAFQTGAAVSTSQFRGDDFMEDYDRKWFRRHPKRRMYIRHITLEELFDTVILMPTGLGVWLLVSLDDEDHLKREIIFYGPQIFEGELRTDIAVSAVVAECSRRRGVDNEALHNAIEIIKKSKSLPKIGFSR